MLRAAYIFPDIYNLRKVKGVGEKVFDVVLNLATNTPYVGVDTHVMKVTNRLVGISGARNVRTY